MPADARSAMPANCRAGLLLSGTENPWPSPVEVTPAQDATSVEARKKEWVERYLSVCYPLRHIRVTSPYGYRSDPFTGKRRFHDGLDLHARGEAALAMMEGVVVRVGQDRSSGQVRDPAARQLHRQLLPPLEDTRRQRNVGTSARCGRRYRLYGAQHGRAPAHYLQTRRPERRSLAAVRLH